MSRMAEGRHGAGAAGRKDCHLASRIESLGKREVVPVLYVDRMCHVLASQMMHHMSCIMCWTVASCTYFVAHLVSANCAY